FIYERVQRHGYSNTLVPRAQLSDLTHKTIAQYLLQIHDKLEADLELQRMINDSSLSTSRDVFMRVASEIFSDGRFSWGRVVA
ncbi:apoptosis regulator BAX, partial [Larimichthys crocea]|uniref:apoptosis regulator BAX n=1 Tax=Larimichthys crocea TaxID=215358 RepID=UPI000F5F6ED5